MRPGHHRPLGTTTRMRFPDWPNDEPFRPALGDVIRQETCEGAGDEGAVRRAYLLVGIEETRTGYRFLAERVAYEAEPVPPGVAWSFWNLPR